MTRLITVLVAGALGFGVVTPTIADDWRHENCDRRDRYCDDNRRDWRDRDRDRDYNEERGYRGRPPSYGSQGSCTFQGPRGPVAGYKPEGKDRCCIETRNGPSCQ